ncbi:MAG: methyltransferase domain-containing protein [Anaerolineae bacterium]
MIWLVILVVGLCAALLYWLLVTTEGAYLGARVVQLIYDWGAGSYDEIKEFSEQEDDLFLARPLMTALSQVRYPLVLDVATGTGRLPLALLRYIDFQGYILGLDISLNMLREARRKTLPYGKLALIQKNASLLPFSDESFHAVTCLEALEFLPDPNESLREMARVLKVGGLLLTTNRVGFDYFLFPGRAFRQSSFEELMRECGLDSVETKPWQEHYDLIWARKTGNLSAGDRRLGWRELLLCPFCWINTFQQESNALICGNCGRRFPFVDGILCFDK